MQLHQLKPTHKNKARKRVGRGGKRGTYAGRGVKGQKSRSGPHFEPLIRGMIKKYPKLRGYKFNTWKTKPIIINISVLEKEFKTNDIIDPSILLSKGIISKMKGKMVKIKILGKGEIKKSLTIKGCEVSQSAKEKIEKAGGKVI